MHRGVAKGRITFPTEAPTSSSLILQLSHTAANWGSCFPRAQVSLWKVGLTSIATGPTCTRCDGRHIEVDWGSWEHRFLHSRSAMSASHHFQFDSGGGKMLVWHASVGACAIFIDPWHWPFEEGKGRGGGGGGGGAVGSPVIHDVS